jgi:hypothetical protein
MRFHSGAAFGSARAGTSTFPYRSSLRYVAGLRTFSYTPSSPKRRYGSPLVEQRERDLEPEADDERRLERGRPREGAVVRQALDVLLQREDQRSDERERHRRDALAVRAAASPGEPERERDEDDPEDERRGERNSFEVAVPGLGEGLRALVRVGVLGAVRDGVRKLRAVQYAHHRRQPGGDAHRSHAKPRHGAANARS